jgi:hypothetical protein
VIADFCTLLSAAEQSIATVRLKAALPFKIILEFRQLNRQLPRRACGNFACNKNVETARTCEARPHS